MLQPCIQQDLPMPETNPLIEQARTAATSAYCPYSRFAVGAAIEWEDGSCTTGVNVENASYPVSLCAERSAVSAGVGAGRRVLRRVAVWADVEDVVAPCGACRQVLQEFCGGKPEAVEVILAGRSSARETTLAALLPEAFGPDLLHR